MEAALNWMTYRYEENNLEKEDETQFSKQCLVENAEQIILDQYSEEWHQIQAPDKWVNEPSTSGISSLNHGSYGCSIESDESPMESSQLIYSRFDDSNTNGDMGEDQDQVEELLYCFTCGVGKKNRKALYRHGVSSGHIALNPEKKKKKEKIEFITPCSSVSGMNVDEHIGNELNFEDVCSDLTEEQPILSFSEIASVQTCYTCGTKFSNRKGLYRHGIKTGHKTRERRAEQSRGGSIGCSICQYSTTTISYLKRHLKRSHGVSE